MLIRVHPTKLIAGDTTYIVRICGEERLDGTWERWLEFHSADATKPALLTEQERSQPNRTALEYWADGLEQHRRAREEALPLPSRTHPQKQTLVIYTEEFTYLAGAYLFRLQPSVIGTAIATSSSVPPPTLSRD